MEDIERIKGRLENIRSVEPIIRSLRTVAAGGWRVALTRLQASKVYVENLMAVLAGLVSHISPARAERALVVRKLPAPRRAMMVVIASERGLCGAFNDTVLAGAERLIAQQLLQSDQVFISTLGSRARAYFESRGHELFVTSPLPVTRVPSYEMVREIGQSLLDSMYSNEIDVTNVICAPYKLNQTLAPVSRPWLPIEVTMLPRASRGLYQPIVETDKEVLFERAIEEWTLARFYQFVMESAASEQSARFRAMDAASDNLGRIIDELTLNYHTARQHAITMEMLDLVGGSGMLRGPPGRQSR